MKRMLFAMVAGSILLLILEMLKAARMSRRGFMDHLLSMMLFAAIKTASQIRCEFTAALKI